MNHKPIRYTAAELAGLEKIPETYSLNSHLIYSSPATLAYNSPGAEGFGVKRAGLAVPGSVMLIVSPGCCGRNTSEISSLPRYRERFFYLTMSENDLITGKHLTRIPEAVGEICRRAREKPSVVMICVTCVDALLGTDMDRVCRKAETAAGVRVRPCYMYALTREGRKPPMVHVRESLYSLLEKRQRKRDAVGLLGFFAPLREDFELYRYLRAAGVRKTMEVSRCESYEEYLEMAEVNFNLVLNPEAGVAAESLRKRLEIPWIELSRFYGPRRNHRQYQALAAAVGIEIDDRAEYEAVQAAAEEFRKRHSGIRIAIGECMNGNPLELAVALSAWGAKVTEIYRALEEGDMLYLRRLAEISPDTEIFCNQEPTMLYYDSAQCPAELTVGKDAAFYQPDAAHIFWNEDIQPYGYAGTISLLCEMERVLEEEKA